MSDVEELSPGSPPSIDEADVTNIKLASILTSQGINNTIDDKGYIHATDGIAVPAWISIDADRKFLCFYTNCELEDIPTNVLLAAINALNRNHIVVQFHFDGGSIGGHYWMTFDRKLDTWHFVKMFRRFSSAFESGIKKLAESLPGELSQASPSAN